MFNGVRPKTFRGWMNLLVYTAMDRASDATFWVHEAAKVVTVWLLGLMGHFTDWS